MEAVMKEKIDEIIRITNEKIDQFNKEAKVFKNEFMTKEMKEILIDVIENSHMDYCFELNKDWNLIINNSLYIKLKKSNDHYDSRSLYISSLVGNHYNDNSIRCIQTRVKYLNETQKLLNLLSDRAEDIIEDITEKYRERNENRTDILNSIMDMLDSDAEKIKHIKVTVEWI